MKPPAGVNPFAQLAEDDEDEHPPVMQPPAGPNPFVNQVADSDSPWEEVRRNGQAPKSSLTKPALKTLVIRDQIATPLTRRNTQKRESSSSTQESDSTKKSVDPHENWCGVCHVRLPNKNALLAHIKQSPHRHENYCNLCKRVFVDRNGLKNHNDHAAGHEVTCNLCLSAFKNAWGLKNHLENNYSVAGHDWVCLTCLQGFRHKFELDKHLVTGPKHVDCLTCHRKFPNQAERDRHWRRATRHKHCLEPGCDFDAPNADALEIHHRDDHFQCRGCKCILPSQTKLNLHYDTCDFEVYCSNCDYQCAGWAKLELHMDSGCHTPTASIPCWLCTELMYDLSGVINHLEVGACAYLPDSTKLLSCLGTFWYSTLYMDVDMHVQIRSNIVDMHEIIMWIDEGVLEPFICRASGCGATFPNLASLVCHVENSPCEWTVDRLRLDLVQAELKRMYVMTKAV